jgi:GxxExxY protein
MSQGMLISEQVISCAFEVSNTLGAGFFEKVYENALCVEFSRAGIPFCRQQRYGIRYKNENIGDYMADIVVDNKLLIELKALSALNREHEAQVMNYLKASGLRVGLLLNFGTSRMAMKRIVWNHDESEKI